MDLFNNLGILMAAVNKMAYILILSLAVPSVISLLVFRKGLVKMFR